MGRTLKVILSIKEREELETGYRQGKSHCFRQRCRMVLLKSQGVLSKEIVKIVGIKSEHQVNGWIKRYTTGYSQEGLWVLQNAAGQGRKAIFDQTKDKERVRAAVQQERQRLSQAKGTLEAEMGKNFHLTTLKRFLKNLTAATREFASV